MPSPATLLKRWLWHSWFPVKFAKFLRTTFLQNSSGRLFLNIVGQEMKMGSLNLWHDLLNRNLNSWCDLYLTGRGEHSDLGKSFCGIHLGAGCSRWLSDCKIAWFAGFVKGWQRDEAKFWTLPNSTKCDQGRRGGGEEANFGRFVIT